MIRPTWFRISLLTLATGVAALVASAVLLGLSASGAIGGGGQAYSDAETITGFGNVLDLQLYASPTVEPAGPAPSTAPVQRITIPRIEVDAPVVVKSTDANGVMESPDGPWDVAWYDFSARPGFGGNAVFSGHVDYRNVGPAVFWRLRELELGDAVQVRLADGTDYGYRVTAKSTFDAATAPISDIVGPTAKEVITLITCAGTFDRATRQYDQRLVVRAERVPTSEPLGLTHGD